MVSAVPWISIADTALGGRDVTQARGQHARDGGDDHDPVSRFEPRPVGYERPIGHACHDRAIREPAVALGRPVDDRAGTRHRPLPPHRPS